jgi:hypothetical protein
VPRARKTMAGQTGQAAVPFTGQTYGDAKAQEGLQRAMPAPKVETTQAPTPSPEPVQVDEAVAGPEPAAVPRRMSPQEAMQYVAGQGGLLSAPDDKPNVPVTDGLPTGPGRGPEALRGTSQMGNLLRRLGMQTGDPTFMQIASKIGL